MTLWEIGKLREGWVKANSPSKKEDATPAAVSEEEFHQIMAMEINEGEEGSVDDFIKQQKARQ